MPLLSWLPIVADLQMSLAEQTLPLEIRLLGELQVVRAGELLTLPPSKKTRALLGYLLLTQRAQRRERLCELFWDVADDPRAALRWSLSKLRELLDGAHGVRLLADREQVAIEPRDLTVDALVLRQLLGNGVETAPSHALERALPLFRGELLEGLELPEFHAYHAFCVAERSALRALHRRVLSTLLTRCEPHSQQVLPLLRALVQLDPLDSQRRAQLFELLRQTGRASEADQQLRNSQRLLDEPSVREVVEPNRERNAWSQGQEAAALFVGRAGELARLGELLRRPESGLRCALISGDPGIGKSRLLMEVLRVQQVRGESVRKVAVQEERLGFPFAAFRELLRGLPSNEPLPWRDRAPEGAGAVAGTEHERERLFRAVAAALESTAREQALVLVIEDIQWLDTASLSLLHFLCGALSTARITVLLSARRGELHDQPAVRRVLRALKRELSMLELPLGPLTASETAQLVVHLHSQRDPHDVLTRSAGHPLYVHELSRHAPGSEPGLPASLLELIRDRLAALPQEPLELLRWASVLGSSFDGDTLGRLLTYTAEQLVEALEHLERHGFLRFTESAGTSTPTDSSCQFAHDVVRHALYDQLSEPRRRLMHARVARLAMESGQLDDERAAYVAHHASLGGDRALAAEACLVAGRRCLRLFAPVEALALARRGLTHAAGLDDVQRVPVSLSLLEVALVAARPLAPEHAALLASATTRALDLGATSQARQGFFLQSLMNWEAGRSADAGRFSREAERISRAGSLADRLLGLGEAARCLVALEQELPEAEAFLLEAEVLAERSGLALPVCALLARGALQLYRGDYPGAESNLEEARQRARADGERLSEFYALEWLVDAHLQRAQYEQAEQLASALGELGERLRQGSELPFAQTLLVLARHGRQLAVGSELVDAIAQLDRVDAKQRSAVALSRLAQLELSRGELSLARGHAQRAHALASAIGRHSEQHEALALLALVHRRAALSESDGEQLQRIALLEAAPPIAAHSQALVAQALAGDVSSRAANGEASKQAKKEVRHGTRDRGKKRD